MLAAAVALHREQPSIGTRPRPGATLAPNLLEQEQQGFPNRVRASCGGALGSDSLLQKLWQRRIAQKPKMALETICEQASRTDLSR